MPSLSAIRRLTVEGRSQGLDKVAADLDKVAAGQQKVAATAAPVATSQDRLSRSALSAGSAFDRLSRSIDPVFRAQQMLERGQRIADRALEQGAITAERHAATMRRLEGAMQRATLAGANDNIVRTGRLAGHQLQNLSYQVNDLGVQLASGHSPFVALIQQGAQVTQILGQSEGGMRGGVRALGAEIGGLAMRFGPVALLIGAMAGGVAALSSEIEDVTKKNVSFGNVMTGMWGMLVDGATTASSGIGSAFGGVWEKIEAFARQEFNAIAREVAVLGAQIGLASKSIEAVWAGGVERIKLMWSSLPAAVGDFVIETANRVLKGIESMINTAVEKMNAFIKLANDNLGLSLGEFGKVEFGQISNPNAGASAKFAEAWAASGAKQDTAIKDAMAAYEKQKADIKKWDPFADLTERSVAAANEDAKKLKKGGSAAGGTDRTAKAYDDLTRSAQAFIAEQGREAQALGMTEEAAGRLRHTQDLLAKAANDNLKLTPALRAELEGLGGAMAAAEARTNRLREAYDLAKGTVTGFFEDLRSGLASGEGVWKSFGTAALNVLDSLSKKAMEMASTSLFDSLWSGSGIGAGGGGGLLGSLLGAFGGGGGSSALLFHAGGMVGRDGMPRAVDPLAFAGAPRLHRGTLAADEVPAILQRGEQVLSRQHVAALKAVRDAPAGLSASGGSREPEAQRPVTVSVTIVTQDAQSFSKSRAQVETAMARAVARGQRGL